MFGIALAFCAGTASFAFAEPARMDFIAHYAAASLVLHGRAASILDPDAVLAAERAAAPAREGLLPWNQVPALALIRAPLALLPFEAALLVVAAIDAVMIAAAIALLVPRERAVWAMLLVAPPSALAVAHGQTSPLALLLVALAQRPVAGPRGAGLALGLTLLRLQSAPLLLLAGLADPVRRRWTIVGAAAVAGVSAAVVGVGGLVRYAAYLLGETEILRSGAFGTRVAVGWSGLGLWLGAPELGIVASVVSLAAGAVVVVRCGAADRPAVAAAWSLLAAPNLLLHDAVLAYPALVLLASRRSPWDAASVAAWTAHLLLAPLGVLWSLVLAVAVTRRASRPPSPDRLGT